MHDGRGRNDIQSTIGKFSFELPRILPAFERTEPRTTHHWRDAMIRRRMTRRGRRHQLALMALQGAKLLDDLVNDHRSTKIAN